MDHDRYGLDGQPIYPRSGPGGRYGRTKLWPCRLSSQRSGPSLALPLAVIMVVAGAALAYMANIFG